MTMQALYLLARDITPWYATHGGAKKPVKEVIAFAQGYLARDQKPYGAFSESRDATIGDFVQALQAHAESEEKDLAIAMDRCGPQVPEEKVREKKGNARVARSIAGRLTGGKPYDLGERIMTIGEPKQKEIEYGGRTQG